MTVYFLDCNSIREFRAYYPTQFPKLWKQIDRAVAAGTLRSVDEVFKELDAQGKADHVATWITQNRSIFQKPTTQELAYLRTIFAVPHFKQLIGERQMLRGSPVADPFLVAAAKIHGGCVVTEESCPPNGAKVPNVCERFHVPCINLQGMMAALNWVF